jgi:hypothetical protein
VVGRIARNSNIAPDTNWKTSRIPGQDFERVFADMKARIFLEALPMSPFQELFDQSIHCLRTITNAANVYSQNDLLCGNPRLRTGIPLSHPFFESVNKIETKFPKQVFEWFDAGFNNSTSLDQRSNQLLTQYRIPQSRVYQGLASRSLAHVVFRSFKRAGQDTIDASRYPYSCLHTVSLADALSREPFSD